MASRSYEQYFSFIHNKNRSHIIKSCYRPLALHNEGDIGVCLMGNLDLTHKSENIKDSKNIEIHHCSKSYEHNFSYMHNQTRSHIIKTLQLLYNNGDIGMGLDSTQKKGEYKIQARKYCRGGLLTTTKLLDSIYLTKAVYVFSIHEEIMTCVQSVRVCGGRGMRGYVTFIGSSLCDNTTMEKPDYISTHYTVYTSICFLQIDPMRQDNSSTIEAFIRVLYDGCSGVT